MLIAFLRMCDPSKGGIGMRLNTKRTQFNSTIIWKRSSPLSETGKPKEIQVEKNNVATKAMSKLDKGPAMVIKTSSLFRVLGLGSDILTGFPHPKIANPGETKIMIKGRTIVPIGSI
jgi:hypothetical protein